MYCKKHVPDLLYLLSPEVMICQKFTEHNSDWVSAPDLDK